MRKIAKTLAKNAKLIRKRPDMPLKSCFANTVFAIAYRWWWCAAAVPTFYRLTSAF